jgi:hypothetical protein
VAMVDLGRRDGRKKMVVDLQVALEVQRPLRFFATFFKNDTV